MTNEELIARLRGDHPDYLTSAAADRIEALVKERDALKRLKNAQSQMLDAEEARVKRLEAALHKLHHAVCGETGFAACVRMDSGKAYPWPALDEADAAARAVLKGTDHE